MADSNIAFVQAVDVEDDLEKDIDYILTRADLQGHREAFIRLGVVKVKHFLDVEDDNLESDIGLTKIEARRLRRNFSEVQAESKKRDLHSTGKLLSN